MQIEVEGRALIVVDATPGKKPTLERTDIRLDIDAKLDPKQYYKPDGNLTDLGAKSLSNAFVQGLLGNIHAAHQNGDWDSAEHLRWIMAELERGFVRVVETKVGNYGEKEKETGPRWCPKCFKNTQQVVTLYNPDDPKSGEVWECTKCQESTGWAN